MRENEQSSSRSDGEIKDEDSPSNNHQERILQLVLGQPSEEKEDILRQKLLEKKAKITEDKLRKKLLERRGQTRDDGDNSAEEQTKMRKKRSRSFSSVDSESTPPKRKRKKSKKKKSKKEKKSKKKENPHFKNLNEKSVLNRVIIRHLNPQDEPDKDQKKKKKKRQVPDDERPRRRDHQSPRGNALKNRSPPPFNDTFSGNKPSKSTEPIVIEVQDDSPIPSPKIFLYPQYTQNESTSYGEYPEGSIETKPFEELTEEEKAMLSPTLLKFKENIHQKQLVAKLPTFYPGISGCRSVDEFMILNKIEEGTFGVTYRALELGTDEIVALKRLKMENEKEGFPITSLREINMLMKCRRHPNVVNLREIVVGSTMDKIYLVMEYVEHDMKVLLKHMDERKKKFKVAEIKTLMQQLLSGCAYLHEEWVLHRDLKTSNLLLTHNNILKIGDFGLSREYGEPLKQYTPVVVTLWYRSPELLLGCKTYSTAIDIWSIGCIFGEFMRLRPIFPGTSEMDQLNKIFMDTGTPNKTVWPSFDQLPGISRCVFANTPYNQLRKKFMADLKSEAGLDFLNRLLALDPERRVTAETALKHPFFVEEPKPASLDTFPTWPSRNETKSLLPTRLNLPSAVNKSGLLPLEKNKQQLFDELDIDSNSLVAASNGFSLNLGGFKK